MEALAALGVAAAAVQFLDYGTSLLRITTEVFDDRSPMSVEHLNKATRDLQDFVNALSIKPLKEVFDDSKQEKALQDLIGPCRDLANELMECIRSITFDGNKKWSNLLKAIKTVWNDKRIESMAKRLSDYRGQLTLRLLNQLNNQYASLKQGQDKILEIVAVNESTLTRESIGAEERHAETIAAIITSTNGLEERSRTIVSSNFEEHLHAGWQAEKSRQTVLKYQARNEQSSLGYVTGEAFNASRRILNALHFRSIRDRSSTVLPAHETTFHWVFEDPQLHGKPWDNLVEWLEEGTGCYWINGKAGSGKSTLMKYLHQHERTNIALSTWSEPSQLICPSFYFWYAGSHVQKSQAGLLRSLLFDVISARQELAFTLFPDVCRHLLSQPERGQLVLSEIELLKAFRSLPELMPDNLKVCFIVDGIDEFVGENDSLFTLFAAVTASPALKILLSSRPTPACVYAFARFPQLKLQDLTFQDIYGYVKAELSKNYIMQKLELADPGATSQLIITITARANGVFLWVVLVVQRLMVGLQDYDDLHALMQKVEELPSDLEKLYNLMLEPENTSTFSQCAKLLQAVVRSYDTHEGYPITLLQLSFIEDGSFAKSFQSEPEILTTEGEDWRCEVIEGRIRSRCRGLLESRNAPSPYSIRRVGFLHRTAFDYLRTDKVWLQLTRATANINFDIPRALMGSCLLEMKAKADPNTSKYRSPPYESILRMLSYWHNMELRKDKTFATYITAASETLSLFWHDATYFDSAESQKETVLQAVRKLVRSSDPYGLETLALSAAIQCPPAQIDELLVVVHHKSSTEDFHRRSELTANLITLFVDEKVIPLRCMCLSNVTTLGVPPQTSVSLPSARQKQWDNRWQNAVRTKSGVGLSLWEFILRYCFSLMREKADELRHFMNLNLTKAFFSKILMMIMKQGADASITLLFLNSKSSRNQRHQQEISASTLLLQIMKQTWDVILSGLDHVVPSERKISLRQIKNEVAPMFLHIETQLQSASLKVSDADPTQDSVKEAKKDGYSNKIPRALPSKSIKAQQPIKFESFASPKVERTPWRVMLEQDSITNIPSRPKAASQRLDADVANAANVQTDRWESTAPSARINLLEPEEQALVLEMARTDLTPKQQRALTNQLFRLPAHRREKILECSKAPAASA